MKRGEEAMERRRGVVGEKRDEEFKERERGEREWMGMETRGNGEKVVHGLANVLIVSSFANTLTQSPTWRFYFIFDIRDSF